VEYVVKISRKDSYYYGIFRFKTPENFRIKEQDIRITVSKEKRPVFSWEGMGVSSLTVYAVENRGTNSEKRKAVWYIISQRPGKNIYSPVLYGQIPDKAYDQTFEGYRQLDLTPGGDYEIEVSRFAIGDKGTAQFTTPEELE